MVIFTKVFYMYSKLFQIVFQQSGVTNLKLPRDPFQVVIQHKQDHD
jgi:hypothetical protein